MEHLAIFGLFSCPTTIYITPTWFILLWEIQLSSLPSLVIQEIWVWWTQRERFLTADSRHLSGQDLKVSVTRTTGPLKKVLEVWGVSHSWCSIIFNFHWFPKIFPFQTLPRHTGPTITRRSAAGQVAAGLILLSSRPSARNAPFTPYPGAPFASGLNPGGKKPGRLIFFGNDKVWEMYG